LVASGGVAAAGCTTSGSLDMGALGAGGGSSRAATVAFESIDGPPEAVFRRLVERLGQEASARNVAMVSHEQVAQYRIRGYIAAHVQGQRTTITWVWDVFTAGRERVARFTGEVPGAASERAWAAADEAAVARMAQDGMSRLAVFLDSSTPHGASSPVASVAAAQEPLAFLPSWRP
jgi:predicted YcjX-like family ATPase